MTAQPVEKRHFRVPVNAADTLHAFLMQPAQWRTQDPTVVFSHGFTVDGTESARHFLVLAEAVCARGWRAFLFDYRGSGYSDLAFADMRFDTEVDDLTAVLAFASADAPESAICLWAESMGTAVAAHTAATRARVELAVLWSLSAELHRRYQERYGRLLGDAEYVYSPSGFKVTRGFLDSLAGVDTYSAIREAGAPCLLVHGDADEVAPVDLSREARRLAPENTTLVVIPGGNHGFEAQDDQFRQALAASLAWMSSRLNA
jgi:uncharacterized protein